MSSDTSTVAVTVADGWAVFHDGQQHSGGTVLTVDATKAEQWIANGWATPAPPVKARSARSVPTD